MRSRHAKKIGKMPLVIVVFLLQNENQTLGSKTTPNQQQTH